MRKVLYISIAISLLIVAAALVHYNWRADQLREPLAQIPDSAAPEHRTAPAASVIDPPAVDRSSASTAPSVDTQLLSLEKEEQLADINAMIQRMDEAYEAEQARHEAAMAAIPRYPEHLERERLERRARLAALEAGHVPQTDPDDSHAAVDLPAQIIKDLEAGLANDETLRHLVEHGTGAELEDYLKKAYLADFLAGLQIDRQ